MTLGRLRGASFLLANHMAGAALSKLPAISTRIGSSRPRLLRSCVLLTNHVAASADRELWGTLRLGLALSGSGHNQRPFLARWLSYSGVNRRVHAVVKLHAVVLACAATGVPLRSVTTPAAQMM